MPILGRKDRQASRNPAAAGKHGIGEAE